MPKASLSLETQLDQQVEALDRLVAQVRGGVRSADHFDKLEQDATGIADAIRAAFRWRA